LAERTSLIAGLLDDRAFLLARVRRAVDRMLLHLLLLRERRHAGLTRKVLLLEVLLLHARLIAGVLDDRTFLLTGVRRAVDRMLLLLRVERGHSGLTRKVLLTDRLPEVLLLRARLIADVLDDRALLLVRVRRAVNRMLFTLLRSERGSLVRTGLTGEGLLTERLLLAGLITELRRHRTGSRRARQLSLILGLHEPGRLIAVLAGTERLAALELRLVIHSAVAS